MDEDENFRLSTHIHSSNGYSVPTNQEENILDHLYCRSQYCRPEYIFCKPPRALFVHPSAEDNFKSEEEVDVETVPPRLPPVYDTDKASTIMNECERHVSIQHPDEGNPDWEEHVPKINWSNMQMRLFNRVVRVLHSDRLSRLTHVGDANEPVLRRITVDKTARRLRQTLASVAWNIKYTQWLHNTLMDNLPAAYLVSYLDALQTLKAKVPTLVERMIASVSTRALASPSHELLSIVHKRPWDPLTGGISRYKPRKLPKDPILVMVPSGPATGNMSNSRTHHWMANLSALGTVVCVYSPAGRLVGKVSVANCLDHMLTTTRAKVAELHHDYGDKPVILVGIGSGAALALQVALVEKVTAVVCLGLPLYTAEDNRGMADDALLNIQVPVLFVTGQNCATSSIEDMEELREHLNVVTSLVVVGGADDQLRLSNPKKKLEGITQTLVDKCIMDEVGDFLGTLLSPDYIPPSRPLVVHPIEPPPKRAVIKPVERKRKCDIVIPTSPPVPAKKGRKPKISMMQKMVQNKWAGQIPSTTELPVIRTTAASSPSLQASVVMAGGSKHVMLDKKSLQQLAMQQSTTIQQQPPTTPAEGTITVVAASAPTLNPNSQATKTRLASGQLTSLSKILQPGTRGILSQSRTSAGRPTADEGIISLSHVSQNQPPVLDELNILDMPIILGDQNEELLPTEPITQPIPNPTPIRLVLANKATSSRPGVKCTKIYISKGPASGDTTSERKTVYIGDINRAVKTVPKIRHIPATRNSQFY